MNEIWCFEQKEENERNENENIATIFCGCEH